MGTSITSRGNALQHAFFAIILAVLLGGCVTYAGGPEPGYGYGVEVGIAPPPVRVVEAPPPRVGYVGAPG